MRTCAPLASLDYFGAQAEVKGKFDASASGSSSAAAPLDFAAASVPNSDINYMLCEGVNYAYLVSGVSPEEPSQAGKAGGRAATGDMLEFEPPAAEAQTSVQVSAAAWPAPEIERFMAS